jgi:DNA-binding transcriptional ArsR family regulator
LNRQQIADYLGMRQETVSREFTKLRHLRIIELVEADKVVVLDEEKLLDLSKSLDSEPQERGAVPASTVRVAHTELRRRPHA